MELYPLTKPQRSIFDMQQYYGGAIANITGAAFFDEPVELSALRRAFGKAFELHNSLRIRIKIKDGTPMQYITPHKSEEFDELCFDVEHDFETWLTTLARTPLDMGGALCKIVLLEVAGRTGYVIHLHHLIADAWTYGILTDTIAKYLKNELPERTYSYLDYIETEKEYAKSPRREKDKAYFLSCFEKCSEPTYLCERPAKNNAAEQLKIAIDKKTSAKITAFCENNSISPYSLFMNTLAVYIYRIKGVNDIYIGTAILNRSGKKEKSTAGMYINTVPVLMQVSDTLNISENIQSNSVSIMGILRHQRYQYNEFLSDIREKYGFKGRLYDVVLSYQNAVLPDGVTARWVFPGCQSEALNIHMNDRQHEGVYHIDYRRCADNRCNRLARRTCSGRISIPTQFGMASDRVLTGRRYGKGCYQDCWSLRQSSGCISRLPRQAHTVWNVHKGIKISRYKNEAHLNEAFPRGAC